MSFRHALVTAAAVVALAPATAFAQGAGDDQYSDPFSGESKQAAPTPTPAAPRPPATATPAPAQAAATATPAPAQAAATAAPAPSQPTQNGPSPGPPTLPYTGVDPWPMALGGVLLLGTGLALRLRVARGD